MSDSQVIELAEELNDLCSQLSDSLEINCGGCCYVASILAEGLSDLHIPFKVSLTRNLDVERALEVRRFIKEKKDFYCEHVFIYLHKHNLYINDDGDANRNVKVGCIKSKDLLEYYKSVKWNRVYDTKYNKVVAEEIRNIFKKYESKA